MPVLLIFSVILGFLGAGGLLIWFRSRDGLLVAVAGGLTSIAVLFLALSCFDTVPTRDIGIVKSFGKPVDVRSNGLVWKLPWQKLSTLNGTVRTDVRNGGFGSDGKCVGGTPVRLGNQSTACVDNTIRWRINPEAGDELFRDYANDENIKESLVTQELNQALNKEFGTYDPFATGTVNGAIPPDLQTRVKIDLDNNPALKSRIDVQSIIVSILHFDPVTQDKLNKLQGQRAETSIALESFNTARAKADANNALAASVRDVNVLIADCLNKPNNPIPCIPGAGQPFPVSR